MVSGRWILEPTVIYYHAFSEGEVTARVTRDGTRRGVSAQFDKPSEPERRQAARQFNRLPPGRRQSTMEGRKES